MSSTTVLQPLVNGPQLRAVLQHARTLQSVPDREAFLTDVAADPDIGEVVADEVRALLNRAAPWQTE